MASRFPCVHEKWANQRAAAARAREKEPLVMGATPHCPWCMGEQGEEMAKKVMKAIFADELIKTLTDSLNENFLAEKTKKAILKAVKTKSELLLQKDRHASQRAGQEGDRESPSETDSGHGKGPGTPPSGAW